MMVHWVVGELHALAHDRDITPGQDKNEVIFYKTEKFSLNRKSFIDRIKFLPTPLSLSYLFKINSRLWLKKVVLDFPPHTLIDF